MILIFFLIFWVSFFRLRFLKHFLPLKLYSTLGILVVAQWVMNPTSIHEDASLGGLSIWHCCKRWYRSQMRLRPQVAVAVV